jgi:hypothetical protein
MSPAEVIGDQDNPTSTLVNTKSGDDIDLLNLPGKKKMELVLSGELNIDKFVMPANMPGKKLKELRDAHRTRFQEILDKAQGEEDKENTFKVEDSVIYKDYACQVLEIKGSKVKVEIPDDEKAGELKKIWVNYKKLKIAG